MTDHEFFDSCSSVGTCLVCGGRHGEFVTSDCPYCAVSPHSGDCPVGQRFKVGGICVEQGHTAGCNDCAARAERLRIMDVFSSWFHGNLNSAVYDGFIDAITTPEWER